MKTVMNPIDFFKAVGYNKLRERGILNGKRNLLNGRSVHPLVILMKQLGVEKLQHGEWFFDIEYNFRNPKAKETVFHYGKHNLLEVRKGVVFEGQNKLINPYYRSGKQEGLFSRKKSELPIASSPKYIEYDNSIFINEVVSSPENRVNLNLFGLLNIDMFRVWFFNQLGLDPDTHIMFPSKNIATNDSNDSGRPDFAIYKLDGLIEQFVAYLEVELGSENQEQLLRYRKLARSRDGRVFSIVGRKHFAGDMSLEEIWNYVCSLRRRLNEQQKKYTNAFEAMFVEYVLEQSVATGNSVREVSEEMRSHPLVKALTERLDISFETTGNMRPGEFRMNTRKEKGFSLRVYSPISKVQRSLSVMAISGGRPFVIFPAKTKLEKYLPNRKESIREFASILREMGYPIEHLMEKKQVRVPVNKVLEKIDSLAHIIYELGKL